MAQAYLSVKVRRALKFSVQVLGRLENNRAVNLVNKQRFAIILCLALVFSAAGGYVTGTARAAEDNYLLDKVIEWPDGTSERVQIGEDGYFILDGVKKRLVCVNLHIFLPYGNPDLYGGVPPYWLPENLAIYERELSWLQSKGVRVITFDPHYVGWGDGPGHEAERYSPVFDLIYQHKMLFIPQIEGKGMPGFDNLTNPDFVIIDWANETMGTYATRYRDILLNYPNLVGMLLDNELNHPNSGQTYTPAALQNYLSFLRGIFTPLNVPMVNNLVGRLPSYHPDLALATLEATDWQCFTLYAGNLTEYQTVLSNLRSWLAGAGYPTEGWWLEETNKTAGAATGDAANYTIEYLESAFDSGASLVSLFCTNGEGAGGETGFSFFDDAGNPIPSMEAIGAEIERLQTPMSGPSTPPTVVTSDASSVTADSARLNGNLSNLGSSSTVNVSFQWGTSPESYTNETIPQTMGATGPFNFDLTGLNSGSTYYFRAKAVGYGTHYGEGKSFTTTGSVNHPPVLNPIGNKSVNEGQLLEFAISATDPDGDPLTYSASNLPSGATFDTGIHTFSWTPASGQAGTYTDVHFEADDGSLTDSEDITIVVSTPGTSGGGGGGGGGPDTSPPRFSDITVSDINKTSATISWATLEKSDSQIEYWASPHQFSPLDETLVRSHVIQLTDLNPATTYRYRMMSRDAAGNLAVSDEYTLTTPGTPAAFVVSNMEINPTEVKDWVRNL